jgi:predicted methyltransferase
MPEQLPIIPPLLTASIAEAILEAMRKGETSVEVGLDLNLGSERVEIQDAEAIIHGIVISEGQLLAVLRKPASIFAVAPDGLEPIEIRRESYAKLVPTDGAPTIELSGIRMHRTAGIDPFEDSRLKTSAVVRAGDVVLDTCGGLGYTGLWARRLGAVRVVSVEIDPVVIELRRLNPWSREFLLDDTVEKLQGDAAELITSFPGGAFSCILHDPPRFSLAGQLYGAEFIAQMRRVLHPAGRLMFYTGEPYRRGRGRDFVGGVEKRLQAVGLNVVWKKELQAFVTISDGGHLC